MKNKFLLVAIIGVLFVAGVILISCGDGCPGDGKCGYSSGNFNWCLTSAGADVTKIQQASDCNKDLVKQLGDGKTPACTCS